jgi:colanic acid/amylovoran biosynthesis glycosyltransferase
MKDTVHFQMGYLMNSYPMTSTTFIRGEIEALELIGVDVRRFAIRHWGQALVEPSDIKEAARTEYLLTGNVVNLIVGLVAEVFTNPGGLATALGTWIAQMRHSDGGFVKHVAYFLEAVQVRRRTKRAGIRHLHVHFSTNATAVAMLSKLMGGPSYSFTAHGPDEFGDRTSGRLLTKIKHAAFVIAVSDFCKVQLICYSDMQFWDRIHVVRCGIRLDEFTPGHSLCSTEHTFVCVGRLCVQKGQLLLPKAAAALRSEFPDLRIILIGDGPIRRSLEELIVKYNVGDVFELKGWQPNVEVRRAVQESRAFLLPSFAEGLPVAIMEAFALNRPVISTSIAGIPELLGSDCGWIVPAGSESALLEAMRAALRANSNQLEMLGAEGRRRVEERHSVTSNVRQLRRLFGTLLVAAQLSARLQPKVR